jgi:hypothetical protein
MAEVEDFTDEQKRLFSLAAGRARKAQMEHQQSYTQSEPAEEASPMHYMDPKTGEISTPGPFTRALLGSGARIEQMASGLGKSAGIVSPESYQQTKSELDPYLSSTAGKVGGFVGENIAAMPLGMGAGRLASVLARGTTAIPSIVRGGVEGMTQGAAIAEPGDREKAGLAGLVAGGTLSGAGALGKAATTGIPATRSATSLMNRGVQLTPGQMNPKGAWAQIEEVMQGVPIIGPKIGAARDRAWNTAQQLIAQESAPPGFKVQPREKLEHTFRDLADAYETAYDVGKGYPVSPTIMNVGQNVSLEKAIMPTARTVADKDSKELAQTFLENEMSYINKKGLRLQSDDLLDVRSRIRKEIGKYSKIQGNERYVDILKNAEQKFTEALDSQLPADVKPALAAVDKQYGKYKIFENANWKASQRPEGFTPFQFAQAVREASASKGKYARGESRLSDLSGASLETFPNRQPMTGRQLGTLGTIGAAASAAGLHNPYTTALAASLGALPYVEGKVGQVAQSVLRGQTPVQEYMRDITRQMRRATTQQERDALARLLRTSMIQYGVPDQALADQGE